MVAGIYFFKFPNHFAFGGVTDFSTVVSKINRWSASDFTSIMNASLLVLEFIFLSKGFGVRTACVGMVVPVDLSLLEHVCPLNRPLTTEPLLELPFVTLLPTADTATFFSPGASSGDADIIAMIPEKYTSLNIGTILMLMDVAATAPSLFISGPETGLFSTVGPAVESLAIDGVIGNLNLCKCFNIICDGPEPICDYIINTLYRSATVYHAEGAFTHHEKTVIMTTMKRSQALELRNYIRAIEPAAFMLISSSSEIIGKGFLAG